VWCFPHRGNIPISSDKYIITGWLYRTIDERPTMKMISPKVEEKDIPLFYFNHFFKSNPCLFHKYKSGIFQKGSFPFYTETILEWIRFTIRTYENSPLDEIDEIITFVGSSFTILLSKLKHLYHINPEFQIQHWYYIKNESSSFTSIECDLYIQIDLQTGMVYVEDSYRFIQNSLSFFVDFSFDYLTEKREKKCFTLKELAEPFLDLI
jgi:hypothetical protein